ncbi:MAG: NrsF family protein [Xanthobacteraceae bacterium]
MTEVGRGDPHERLIRSLAEDLTPVERLRPPAMRAAVWLGLVAAIAAALACFSDLSAVAQRLIAAPDLWLAVTGSTLTAGLAAIAAFELSLPDRKPMWAVLPAPGVLMWVGASGLGCLRSWLVPGTHDASLAEAKDCFLFIVGLSIPLSVALFVMLRRACPLQPGLTAAVGGVAVAAAAATLLNFFHPYDAAATDIIVHIIAIAAVVAANRVLADRFLEG